MSELERSGGQNFPGGSASQGEVRRICRERDQLKEATSQMEAELIQVWRRGFSEETSFSLFPFRSRVMQNL